MKPALSLKKEVSRPPKIEFSSRARKICIVDKDKPIDQLCGLFLNADYTVILPKAVPWQLKK